MSTWTCLDPVWQPCWRRRGGCWADVIKKDKTREAIKQSGQGRNSSRSTTNRCESLAGGLTRDAKARRQARVGLFSFVPRLLTQSGSDPAGCAFQRFQLLPVPDLRSCLSVSTFVLSSLELHLCVFLSRSSHVLILCINCSFPSYDLRCIRTPIKKSRLKHPSFIL